MSVGRWLVVQRLQGDQPQREVFVVEGKGTLHEKEGHLLEAGHGTLLFPQDDQNHCATGPTAGSFH